MSQRRDQKLRAEGDKFVELSKQLVTLSKHSVTLAAELGTALECLATVATLDQLLEARTLARELGANEAVAQFDHLVAAKSR